MNKKAIPPTVNHQHGEHSEQWQSYHNSSYVHCATKGYKRSFKCLEEEWWTTISLFVGTRCTFSPCHFYKLTGMLTSYLWRVNALLKFQYCTRKNWFEGMYATKVMSVILYVYLYMNIYASLFCSDQIKIHTFLKCLSKSLSLSFSFSHIISRVLFCLLMAVASKSIVSGGVSCDNCI